MAIYVDTSSAVHTRAGLGRYAANLVRELHALLGDRLRTFQNGLGHVGPLVGWTGPAPAGVRWGYKPWRALVLGAQVLRVPMDGLIPGAELFHATEHLLPPFARVPTVLTVHDLIFERFPEYHKLLNYRYLKAAMPLYCRRATAIIAVSEATRADLVACYGLDPARITVIPEAAAPGFGAPPAERVREVSRQYGLPERYVLSVGTLEPRKNLVGLLRACEPLVADGVLDGVVLVGGRGWLYDDLFAYLEALPWRDRVVLTGYFPDADLPALYAGAAVTAQPSLYEGFGLPVLEAMACGSPVCASNSSSLPEVGGDVARYFDPHDVGGMTAALREVLEDTDLRADLRRRGLERAAQFSWRSTAERTVALYERVLGSRAG